MQRPYYYNTSPVAVLCHAFLVSVSIVLGNVNVGHLNVMCAVATSPKVVSASISAVLPPGVIIVATIIVLVLYTHVYTECVHQNIIGQSETRYGSSAPYARTN